MKLSIRHSHIKSPYCSYKTLSMHSSAKQISEAHRWPEMEECENSTNLWMCWLIKGHTRKAIPCLEQERICRNLEATPICLLLSPGKCRGSITSKCKWLCLYFQIMENRDKYYTRYVSYMTLLVSLYVPF